LITPFETFFVDRSDRSLLEMHGPDGLDLLQRISTNDLSKLGVGEHVGTVLTNEKGRIIDVVTVFRTTTDTCLLSGSSKGDENLRSWVERFIITENVHLNSVSENYSQLLIFNAKFDELTSYFSNANSLIARLKYRNLIYAFVVMTRDSMQSVQSKLKSGSVVELPESEYELFRVQNAIPEHSREISEHFNPLEVGLEPLVSFSKGCYVGQEVIARLDTYQKVHRSLQKLQLTEAPLALPQELADAEGRQAGMLTSCVPYAGSFLGLGIVEKRSGLNELRYRGKADRSEGSAKVVN
jgi:tRNA-modifying protein YgfZ